jgi:diguanylate cyclase (GGDEF)-like protein
MKGDNDGRAVRLTGSIHPFGWNEFNGKQVATSRTQGNLKEHRHHHLSRLLMGDIMVTRQRAELSSLSRSKPTVDWIDRLSGLDVDVDDASGSLVNSLLRSSSADAPVFAPERRSRSSVKVELETLKSINARLLREIDLLKEREAHALKLADRDGLTGLYNRRRMTELLGQTILEASAQHYRFAVLFIDLDGFKRINDRFGHTLGDELLITVAGRIATRARTGDIVCRYGGDEFIVILPRVPSRSAAEDVAASIGRLVALPCKLSGEELRVTAAVGASLFPDDGQSASELLGRADRLMYRAKFNGADVGAAFASPLTRRSEDRSKPRG